MFFQPRGTRFKSDLSQQQQQQQPGGGNIPWVEKYRPQTIEQVRAQDEVIRMLRKTIDSNNLPHLLFYGAPGTGKTSTILALARELYGPSLIRQRVLELNASDERGIQVVRDKIKQFAELATPENSFKLIILDEADMMTKDAQSALRRIMEQYAKVTRFCIIGNYLNRIIEPIASRCAKFRFKNLPINESILTLREICQGEQLECSEEALETLIRACEGDMRRTIMLLQSCSKLAREGPITPALVEQVSGVVPGSVLRELHQAAQSPTSNYEMINGLVGQVMAEGYPVGQIVSQLLDLIIGDPYASDKQKAQVAILFGEIDKRIVDGADEELQMLHLMLRLSQILNS